MAPIRRRIAPGLAAVVLFGLVFAASAQAVTYGLPDLEHRNVAAIILDLEGSGAIRRRGVRWQDGLRTPRTGGGPRRTRTTSVSSSSRTRRRTSRPRSLRPWATSTVSYAAAVCAGSRSTGDRQVATSLGLSIHAAWLYLSLNVHRNADGTCTEDSGGPTFRRPADGEVLFAITSWGVIPCVATGINYRVDTPSARIFVDAMIATYG